MSFQSLRLANAGNSSGQRIRRKSGTLRLLSCQRRFLGRCGKGPGLGVRADSGRFSGCDAYTSLPKLPSRGCEWTSHATRGSVAKTSYFPKTISCPALITGESWRSGLNSDSDGLTKKTTIPNEFRESPLRLPRMEIRA